MRSALLRRSEDTPVANHKHIVSCLLPERGQPPLTVFLPIRLEVACLAERHQVELNGVSRAQDKPT
jgi:hypothetical protein